LKLDKTSPIPVYYQILIDLERRIVKKEWIIGEALPAESELVKYYDVSRVTVRQALEKLSAKKVITRKAGRGTFLTHIPETIEHDLSFPSEFKEKIMHYGIELIARVILIEEIYDPKFAKYLEIKETEPIIHIKRLFTSSGMPYSLNHSWLPASLFPDLLEKGLINHSLSQTMESRYGIQPLISDNWIEAIDASHDTATHLEVDEGSVLMFITTIQKMEKRRIFEYSHTYWIRSRIRFHFTNYNAEDIVK
jgi:DNA-binding GntR family transcriptional regulator